MAKLHTFSIKESLNFGWKTFKANWQFLVIAFIIVLAALMIPSWLRDWSKTNLPAVSFLFTIIEWAMQMITGIGIIVISLKFIDGKKPAIEDIYKHYPLLLNYFLGSLLYGIITLLGFILLVIPGIIWGIKYQYTTYLIVDKGMSPLDAFKKSGNITQGHRVQLLLLGLSFMGITILGLIFLGFGLIVAWPIISLSGAFVYRKLSPIKA